MKITFIGHSHINCIERASRRLVKDFTSEVRFVQLRDAKFGLAPLEGSFASAIYQEVDQHIVAQAVTEAAQGSDLLVLCLTGNEHNIKNMVLKKTADSSGGSSKQSLVPFTNYHQWLTALSRLVGTRVVVLPPPPPIESEEFILNNPGPFREMLAINGVAPALVRLQGYLDQISAIKDMATSCDLRMIELPVESFSENGFLDEHFLGKDPTHANEAYGELILRYVTTIAAGPADGRPLDAQPAVTADLSAKPRTSAGRHPYIGLPNSSFWKQAVAQVISEQFDPVDEVPFIILRSDKIATAGSCFAQHISKRIRSAGFQFLVTEKPADIANGDVEARGFYDFSARYGNIYTARQLVQLYDRAYGYFSPVDSYWELSKERFCDPFRPRIEPEGFPSIEALVEDRQRHLASVREMFEHLDIFVYTLGLTECWVSRLDGAAYPLAPGVAGGGFDPLKYEFVNFGVDEVVTDLQLFIRKLRLVNPKAKLILTVSPVPLAATYEPKHVLVATSYSKSVLRVAADIVSRSCENVYYFPSFEIISGNYNRGRYYGIDFRSITEDGVDHVMSVFMRHLTEGGETISSKDTAALSEDDLNMQKMIKLAEVACDEELLERE